MFLPPPDRYWRIGTLLVIGIVMLVSFFGFHRWWEECRGGDPWGYYAHLPAFFIHHDGDNYQKTIDASQEVWPDPRKTMPLTDIGRSCNKYPIGVAVLLLPFFLLGHSYALINGLPTGGFNAPYALSCQLGVIFYVLWGLYVLFGILRRYFSLSVTVLLTIALALATNLYYFTTYNNMMAHALLFALYCFILYAIHYFEDNPANYRRAAAIGLIAGLITLTRLSEVVVVLIPLLWGVYSWQTLRRRRDFLMQHWRALIVAAIVMAIVLFPQAAYYKFVSGHWWYYAYTGESFNFRHPRILDGLFSYTNGWLVYTPIMIFALLGIFQLRRFAPSALGPILVFLSLHIFITYSWWCWNYINGFGSRPMVETYPLMAFPLGAFFSWLSVKRWKLLLPVTIVILFTSLNVFQTIQLYAGILWSENGNKAYYWAIFGSLKASRRSLIAYESRESQPRQKLIKISKLIENSIENSSQEHRDASIHHSGQYSVCVRDSALTTIIEDTREVRPGDWIRADVWGFQRRGEDSTRRENTALLVVEIWDDQGKMLKRRGINITTKIANPTYSIWTPGGPEEWAEADFFVHVPRNFPPAGRIKTYVWNPHKQKLYVDDLSLELWRDEQ